jgi:hypothetical protein
MACTFAGPDSPGVLPVRILEIAIINKELLRRVFDNLVNRLREDVANEDVICEKY